MTNKDKATPRPWKVGHEIYSHDSNDGSIRIDGADGILLANVSDKNLRDKTLRDANASLIVKAVNSHDLFLKASKQLMAEINDARYQGKLSDDTLDMFSRAIKQADGK